jgi:hypothetical protein
MIGEVTCRPLILKEELGRWLLGVIREESVRTLRVHSTLHLLIFEACKCNLLKINDSKSAEVAEPSVTLPLDEH